MKARTYIVILLSGGLLLSGCTLDKKIININQNDVENSTEIVDSTEEKVEKEKIDEEKIVKEFIQDFGLEGEINLIGADEFISINMDKLSIDNRDKLIIEYIRALEENQSYEISLFYKEENLSIHKKIMDILEKDEFKLKHIVYGEEKLKLLKYIDDEKEHNILKETFKKGYCIYSSEGSYYPVIDYVRIYDKYTKYLSESLSEYLKIMSELMIEPTTVEEYLNIPFESLLNRSLKLEKFIENNENFVFIDEIKSDYLLCLWKLLNPNIFDETLDSDFKLAKKTKEVYMMNIDESYVKYGISKILEYEKNNKNFGSYSDMEKFMNYSHNVIEDIKRSLDID